MQFVYDGDFHKVALITGPTHNILALQFGRESSVDIPAVDPFPSVRMPSLDKDAVAREVLAGIAEANEAFNTQFHVTVIRFLEDDSPPESVYKLLAFSLVERLAMNLPFTEAP